MMRSSFFSYNSIILLICVLSLFCSYPYVFNCLLSLPDVKTVGPIILSISIVCYVLSRKTNKCRLPYFIISTAFLQSLVWTFYSVMFADTTYLTRVFFLIWSIVLISLLCKNNIFKDFVVLNNWLLAIQAIGALLAFILVFLGILSPIIYYTLENGQEGFCYILTCTNVALDNVIRAAGFFDEPGALAFWGIFTLVINQLFTRNKYLEYIIIIGLLSTLSAAFFIQVSLYLIFFKMKSFKKALPVILLLICIVFVLHNILDNDYIAKYTLNRFQGGHINSTRYDLADIAKSYFMSSPIFGIGASKMQSITYMGDNPYEILASDGLFGFVFTYLPLVYVMLRYKNKEMFFAFLILFAGYMQRPFHANLLHYFYLYSFTLICYIKYEKEIFNNAQS